MGEGVGDVDVPAGVGRVGAAEVGSVESIQLFGDGGAFARRDGNTVFQVFIKREGEFMFAVVLNLEGEIGAVVGGEIAGKNDVYIAELGTSAQFGCLNRGGSAGRGGAATGGEEEESG